MGPLKPMLVRHLARAWVQLALGACGLLLPLDLLAGPEARVSSTNARPALILVVGAPGEAEFGSNFVRQVELWTGVAARACVNSAEVGLGPATNLVDLDVLKQVLAGEPKETDLPLWLVLIGHGTFDGREARFNLRGPDLAASELTDWLRPFRRPLVIINTASASAPFINQLSATNRVIVTATRSGNEQNFTRFGQYFAEALSRPDADLDKDGQTSVLETFLTASAHVAEFYKTEGRLMTEHALLDDNGDKLGTAADWFRGVRAVKRSNDAKAADGLRAHQIHLMLSPGEQSLPPEIRDRRDAVELAIGRLRESKSQYSETSYYQKLDQLLTELLEVYGNHLR